MSGACCYLSRGAGSSAIHDPVGMLVRTSMRLLLVEDDPDAARVLAKGLKFHGYAVDVIADGRAAITQVDAIEYAAVLLDVMLPGLDGFAACRAIREAGGAVPILMLTARDSVESRIEGLDCGADDYLVKPFDFGELLARLRALIRRGRHPILPDRVTVGGLVLDTRARRVWLDDREVTLTTKEYAFLEYLVRRAGDVVSRADIC